MNVLLLGSGGREHALAWKIAQSPKLTQLFIASGNVGTAEVGNNLDFDISDFTALKKTVLQYRIELVIVGPEAPLVAGIHDFFVRDKDLQHIAVIGPKREGAQLEGSKEFAKKFMQRHHIPTARYQSFTKETLNEAFAYLKQLPPPYVLKADGLAGGKGVLIIDKMEEAKVALVEMLDKQKFGKASQTVVIEEFLEGIEMSSFVLTNVADYVILPDAKDYKRVGEKDSGLNTGGMGAVSPVPFADQKLRIRIEEDIVKPTIKGLQKDGIEFRGFLFFGLMIVNQKPYVIEYNVRMGDPEAEVVIPRIESDLLALFQAVVKGKLSGYTLKINPQTATTVMAVSGGYPESYQNGKEITGLEAVTDSLIFHAGTKKQGGKIQTNGGRVIAVTSFGKDHKEALKKSYANLQKIHFQSMYYRSDIGFDL